MLPHYNATGRENEKVVIHAMLSNKGTIYKLFISVFFEPVRQLFSSGVIKIGL